jgi:hypothetical protein
MKLSIFPNFGALNSIPVFEAFTQGAKNIGYEVVTHDLNADVYVIWSVLWHGRMAQNKPIWDYAKKNKKLVLVLEVGCLKRGETWRVGLNHVNNLGFFAHTTNLIPNRSKKLGIQLRPWSTTGSSVLLCGQHSKSEQWINKPDPLTWVKTIVDTIKIGTSRPIIFRPHPRDYQWAQHLSYKGIKIRIPNKVQGSYDSFDFEDDLSNAWAVINPSSNTGILSVINGVPAFVDNESLAVSVADTNLSNIENPSKPRREEWLEQLCHTEWTIEEISKGTPLERLFSTKS